VELGKPIPMNDVEDYLEHYGVKGMQWGKRRSREALAKAATKREEKLSPEQRADRAKKAERTKLAGSRRTLSDSDLDAIVERMSKEKKLKDLVREDTTSSGSRFAKDISSAAGNKLARNLAVGAAAVTSAVIANKLNNKFDIAKKAGITPEKAINLVTKAGKG
jgi:hypothetical protein